MNMAASPGLLRSKTYSKKSSAKAAPAKERRLLMPSAKPTEAWFCAAAWPSPRWKSCWAFTLAKIPTILSLPSPACSATFPEKCPPPVTASMSRDTASKSWKRTSGKCCASAPGIWPRRRKPRNNNERGHGRKKDGSQKEISRGICSHHRPTERRQVHAGEPPRGPESEHRHLQAANHAQPHPGHRHPPRRPNHFDRHARAARRHHGSEPPNDARSGRRPRGHRRFAPHGGCYPHLAARRLVAA